MTNKDQAYHRLFNAVITFQGADQNGSKAEIRAAAIELEAAKNESQQLLYPSTIPPTRINPKKEKKYETETGLH